MKNPLTPAGIEPATFRSVAQHLTHCATAVPSLTNTWQNIRKLMRSHIPASTYTDSVFLFFFKVMPDVGSSNLNM